MDSQTDTDLLVSRIDHISYKPIIRMETVPTASNSAATDRINSALATLRSDMLDLRQQDVQLMQQLMSINENIQTLTKRRPYSGRQRKTKCMINGRRKFINRSELIPEEESSSADSDSDESLTGIEN
ncbi:uncharacterized protein LOC132549677 [Ylistrum balloti]|uniref:uncharacterized protein LOC132549677 n=1 Tax=Ylistrum balloti TaxID=509963 RepID=UPI002905C02D|nr:uncharacterized protein LOC132549677 [Ylistrum balloti]